jgi:hypothetical protein
MLPGPGQYRDQLQSVKPKVMGLTSMASKTARGAFENVSKSPGPGAYNVNDSIIRAKAPNTKISSPSLSRKLAERYFK